MPTTNEALFYLMDKGVIVAPSKAVNAGGVAVSGLEMSQNSERISWSAEEVDQKLVTIMKNIHKASAEAAEKYGMGYNLVAGANICLLYTSSWRHRCRISGTLREFLPAWAWFSIFPPED